MLDAARGLAAHAGQAAVLSDFDGTLAPIVPDPAAARPLPGTVELLHRLSSAFAVVAVVSGRPAAFLARQLGLDEPGRSTRVRAFGLYGLEEVRPQGARPEGELAPWRKVADDVLAFLSPSMPPGTLLEAKGMSVGLHWRAAPRAEEAVRLLAAQAAARFGLVSREGRMALELLPPVAVDKGSVVRELTSGLSAACFIGDDLGDLAAFAALDATAAGGTDRPPFVGLKLAVGSPEAPPALLATADLVLDGPAEVLIFLGELDRFASAGPGGKGSSSRTGPGRAGPGQTGPGRAGADRAGPGRTRPGQTG